MINQFVQELGKRAAERWFLLLLVPGALFLAVTGAAVTALDHGRWHDLAALVRYADALAARPLTSGQVVLAAGAVLLASIAIGLLATGIGDGVQRLWLTTACGPLLGWAAKRRRRRWDAADADFRQALLDSRPEWRALLLARNRICLVSPTRPTWVGDRLRAAGERVYRTYEVDLVSAWPRLWLSLPDSTRSEVVGAREAFAAATRLAGWGLLYLIPAASWWPAALITVGCCLMAQVRGRAAATILADLVESAVDLHLTDLAEAMRLAPPPGPLDAETGRALTRLFRKGT